MNMAPQQVTASASDDITPEVEAVLERDISAALAQEPGIHVHAEETIEADTSMVEQQKQEAKEGFRRWDFLFGSKKKHNAPAQNADAEREKFLKAIKPFTHKSAAAYNDSYKGVMSSLAQTCNVESASGHLLRLRLKDQTDFFTYSCEHHTKGMAIRYMGDKKEFGPLQAYHMAGLLSVSENKSEGKHIKKNSGHKVNLTGTLEEKYLLKLAIDQINALRPGNAQIIIMGFDEKELSAEQKKELVSRWNDAFKSTTPPGATGAQQDHSSEEKILPRPIKSQYAKPLDVTDEKTESSAHGASKPAHELPRVIPTNDRVMPKNKAAVNADSFVGAPSLSGDYGTAAKTSTFTLHDKAEIDNQLQNMISEDLKSMLGKQFKGAADVNKYWSHLSTDAKLDMIIQAHASVKSAPANNIA